MEGVSTQDEQLVCRHTSPQHGEASGRKESAPITLSTRRGDGEGDRRHEATTRGRPRETQSLASFLAPAYSSRQTRLRTTGSGMRARTRRSCTVISLDPIIFARDTFTFKSPFASAHLTFCTIASHRTRT